MSYKLFWAVCVVALFAVSGCGGGGGGGPAVLLSDTFRTMQLGDRYEYEVSGTDGLLDGPAHYRGTLYVYVGEYSEVYPSGVDYTEFSASVKRYDSGETTAMQWNTYLSQDPDGTCWVHGGTTSSGDYYSIGEPESGKFMQYPGSWYQGLSWSESVDEDIDPFIHYPHRYDTSAAVTGTETISVPAGRFETYRISTTQTAYEELFGDELFDPESMFPIFTSVKTMWFAPQIGAYVREEAELVTSDGQTLSHVSVLRSFELASPPGDGP